MPTLNNQPKSKKKFIKIIHEQTVYRNLNGCNLEITNARLVETMKPICSKFLAKTANYVSCLHGVLRIHALQILLTSSAEAET